VGNLSPTSYAFESGALLEQAASPWSGGYTVEPGLWGYAHIGQFTQAGWKFLDAASGNFTSGGAYQE